jgi:hypothetical protein
MRIKWVELMTIFEQVNECIKMEYLRSPSYLTNHDLKQGMILLLLLLDVKFSYTD